MAPPIALFAEPIAPPITLFAVSIAAPGSYLKRVVGTRMLVMNNLADLILMVMT
jgi:hypothetical protein